MKLVPVGNCYFLSKHRSDKFWISFHYHRDNVDFDLSLTVVSQTQEFHLDHANVPHKVAGGTYSYFSNMLVKRNMDTPYAKQIYSKFPSRLAKTNLNNNLHHSDRHVNLWLVYPVSRIIFLFYFPFRILSVYLPCILWVEFQFHKYFEYNRIQTSNVLLPNHCFSSHSNFCTLRKNWVPLLRCFPDRIN